MAAMTNEKEKKPFEIQKHKRWEHPKVTVIVPVYKVDKYLTQCLNSIVNQTMEELEIIIVDEGDRDRCREIIDYFEAHDPRIVAPHRKNGGYGASCNLGIDMARGEYMAIVESDDYIEPEMYEEMYAYAKALDADVVKTPYYEVFCDGRRFDCNYRKYIKEKVPQNICFSVKDFGEILQVHPSVWSGLYKTEYVNKKKIRFVTKKGSYVDCGFRVSMMETERMAWLDKPYYNWRVDSEGSSTNTYKINQMIERWEEFLATFDDRKEEFEKYYAAHLIGEVWRNLIDSVRFHRIRPTDQDYERIGKIIQYFPEQAILDSNEMDTFLKKRMILMRNDPSTIKKIAEKGKLLSQAKNKITHYLETLCNPFLLLFAFVGFETFGRVAYFLEKYADNKAFSVLSGLFYIIALICIVTIVLVFAAKVARKCLNYVRRRYKEKLQ